MLATALLCFPCARVRRFPLRAGKQALGEEKAGEKKKIIQIIPSIQTKSSPDRWCGWFCAAHSCSVPASFFLLERGGF